MKAFAQVHDLSPDNLIKNFKVKEMPRQTWMLDLRNAAD